MRVAQHALLWAREVTIEDLQHLMGHHSADFPAKRYLTIRDGVRQRTAAAAREALLDAALDLSAVPNDEPD